MTQADATVARRNRKYDWRNPRARRILRQMAAQDASAGEIVRTIYPELPPSAVHSAEVTLRTAAAGFGVGLRGPGGRRQPKLTVHLTDRHSRLLGLLAEARGTGSRRLTKADMASVVLQHVLEMGEDFVENVLDDGIRRRFMNGHWRG